MTPGKQITAIEWIGKTKAKIYIDETLAFILTAADIRSFGLRIGAELSENVYQEIYDDVLLKRAKLKALNLLKLKDYSEYELHTKLKNAFCSTALADSAVEYVKFYHYIDDFRYAQNYVRYHGDGQSRHMLRQKLYSKGIDDAIIDEVLEEYDIEETEQIRMLIRKKFGDYNQLPSEKHQKVLNFLLRRGYSYHDIRAVIKDFDTNE